MNETPIYEITTNMEKDDYRNFLFLTTFQSIDSLVSLFIISILLGAITSIITGFSISSLFFSTLFFFLVLFGSVSVIWCLRIYIKRYTAVDFIFDSAFLFNFNQKLLVDISCKSRLIFLINQKEISFLVVFV